MERKTNKADFSVPMKWKNPSVFPLELYTSIPFTREEIERVGRTWTRADFCKLTRIKTGSPHYGENESRSSELGKASDENLLYKIDWYKDEPFFTKEVCTFGWKFFSKETIKGTKSKIILSRQKFWSLILKTRYSRIRPCLENTKKRWMSLSRLNQILKRQ